MGKLKIKNRQKDKDRQPQQLIPTGGDFITPQEAMIYLFDYMVHYSVYFHSSFTAPPPKGVGYPKIVISPYVRLNMEKFTCYLARDGAVITVDGEPNNENTVIKMRVTNASSDQVNQMPKPEWTLTLDNVHHQSEDPNVPSAAGILDLTLYAYNLSLEEIFNKVDCTP